MDSLYTPINIERKLKLEKDEIISKYRRDNIGKGTKTGVINSFMNMFSNDPMKRDFVHESYDDGSLYEGQVNVDGIRAGKGIMTYPNKNVYVGDWAGNEFHGQGTYFYSNNERYEGAFINGKRQGQGRYFYSNGDMFEGTWMNDLKRGKGVMTQISGDR